MMRNARALQNGFRVAFRTKSFYDELQSYESGGIPRSEVTG